MASSLMTGFVGYSKILRVLMRKGDHQIIFIKKNDIVRLILKIQVKEN